MVLCVVGAIWTLLTLLVRIAYTTLRYLVTIVWLKAGSQCGFDIQCHWQVWFVPCVGSDQKYKCVWLWPSSSFFRNKEPVPERIRKERGEGKERGGEGDRRSNMNKINYNFPLHTHYLQLDLTMFPRRQSWPSSPALPEHVEMWGGWRMTLLWRDQSSSSSSSPPRMTECVYKTTTQQGSQ